MKVKSESEIAQSCLTLSDPMDCSPPGFSIHGIFQARVLEWGAIAFSISLATREFKITYVACIVFLLDGTGLENENQPGCGGGRFLWCESESHSAMSYSATPWTIQSTESSRPEYWSG